jgi:peptidoglycan hydrolase-like protein with peptidoglycan-binding domain
MALKSQLFGGDPDLQVAALSDPAHVIPGDARQHVVKIQLALNRLDKVGLEPDGVYGQITAGAVISYYGRQPCPMLTQKS